MLHQSSAVGVGAGGDDDDGDGKYDEGMVIRMNNDGLSETYMRSMYT